MQFLPLFILFNTKDVKNQSMTRSI